MTNFSESEERQALRREVARLAGTYGREWFTAKARSGEKTTELWLEIGRIGYLGINIPEEYGGGGGGIGDIAAVCEELAAQGCPLLLMVVSPAICGTIISRYGTVEQKRRWLPGICDGTGTMAFAITEPDAGTNTHNITTTARRDGDGWVLNGRKIYISGVDEADHVLVVGRAEDGRRPPRAVTTLRPAVASTRASQRKGSWWRSSTPSSLTSCARTSGRCSGSGGCSWPTDMLLRILCKPPWRRRCRNGRPSGRTTRWPMCIG
jgi:alkylation response protein AidB-like acyl-CoA dehydrogenase